MDREAISSYPVLFFGSFLDYIELTKPRVALLAVATTLLGFFVGSDRPLETTLLVKALFGALLVGGGASALNQYIEREIDAKMKRTENRPIPSGRLRAKNVLIFGSLLSAAGILELALFVNLLTAFLGGVTLFSYVACYTPLKQQTPLCTFVGAVAGALPPVMGWTAANAQIDEKAWALFAILFVWQLPHFFAIAWVYREDYEKSGLRLLFLQDKEGKQASRQVVLYCLLLLPVSLMPFLFGLSGRVYSFAASAAGIGLFSFALCMLKNRPVYAKKFVSASIYYLLVIIIFMMADKA